MTLRLNLIKFINQVQTYKKTIIKVGEKTLGYNE